MFFNIFAKKLVLIWINLRGMCQFYKSAVFQQTLNLDLTSNLLANK